MDKLGTWSWAPLSWATDTVTPFSIFCFSNKTRPPGVRTIRGLYRQLLQRHVYVSTSLDRRSRVARLRPVSPRLTGLVLCIAPPKKRSKYDARGRDRVEINREIVAGLERTANHRARSGVLVITRIRTGDLPFAIPRYSARSIELVAYLRL